MLKLVEDDNLRNDMAGKGWANVESRFHYKRLKNEMKSLYYNLLNKGL